MIKLSCISMITMLLIGSVSACMDERDRYSAGVLFNNNEIVEMSKIEAIGKPNVNYFKECNIVQPVTSAKPIVVLTPEIKVDMHTDDVTVTSLSVNGNTLIMELSYGGGCKTHEFNMYASSTIGESYPPVIFITLSHNANGDVCKALLRETLNFDLSNLANILTGYSSARLSIKVPSGNGTYVTQYAEWYLENTCSVKYRSHHAPEMLVTLEYAPHQITKELFPSLRLTSDPSIQTLLPIDYSKAVIAELKWLTETGIIKNLNLEKITLDATKLKSSGNWYWTKQDSSISYNGVFTYKRDSDGLIKWDNVVYMDTRKDGCGAYNDFSLPSEGLSASSIKSGNSVRNSQNELSVKVNRQCIQIQQYSLASKAAELRLVHINGRVLERNRVMFSGNGTALLPTAGLHPGVYNIIVDRSDTRMVHTFILH